MKKVLILLLVFCLMASFLASCASKEESLPPDTEIEEPAPPPEPEIYTGPVNPLTGLPISEDISSNRPYVVMINNIKKANPQVGISSADIIYEACVEGGITRMMAIYQDFKDTSTVGSIRSSRHYFIDLAQPYDPIYIHAGGSNQAYSAISQKGINNIDGVKGSGETFYRDSERKKTMGSEHSLMLSTEKVQPYLEKKNIRQQHEAGFEINMVFAEDATPQNGGFAKSITVPFSQGGNAKTTTFDYNEAEKVYYVSQYGNPYKDNANGVQVNVSNVLVLFCDTKQIAGDTAGRLDMNLTGSGRGYFASGGKFVNITWEKDGSSSQFRYKLEDGSGLVFTAGKTYINIVPTGSSVVFM